MTRILTAFAAAVLAASSNFVLADQAQINVQVNGNGNTVVFQEQNIWTQTDIQIQQPSACMAETACEAPVKACVLMPTMRMREPSDIQVHEETRKGALLFTIYEEEVEWKSGDREGSYTTPCIDPDLIRDKVLCVVSPWAAKRLGDEKVDAIVNEEIPEGAILDLTL